MAKKTFKGSIDPLEALISSAPPAAENQKPELDPAQPIKKETLPTGYKNNPALVETRNRRLQLLITQSLARKLKAKAAEQGRSVNDLINETLEAAMQD